MLENLILAYRCHFHDITFKRIFEVYRRDKKRLWFTLVAFIFLTASGYVIFFQYFPQNFPFLATGLFLYLADERSMTKRYRQLIDRKKEHIDNVVQFLKTAIPDRDLSSKELVEELIDRLSVYINVGRPFNKVKTHIVVFGKYIFLPTATFIAGLYTVSIREMEFALVFSYAILFTVLIGVALSCVISLQELLFPNYYASIAFREDLWDIRLLFFAGDSQHESSQHPLA